VQAHLPFAFAEHFQTRRVDHQYVAFARGKLRLEVDLERAFADAQRAVVGHAPLPTGDGAQPRKEAFERAQRQPGERLDGEGGFDGRVAVEFGRPVRPVFGGGSNTPPSGVEPHGEQLAAATVLGIELAPIAWAVRESNSSWPASKSPKDFDV